MRVPRLMVLTLLCALTAAPGAAGGDTGPQQAAEAHALPSIPSSSYPYYQALRNYTFDAGEEGWTRHDLTSQTGTFWHVDNFAGLSGYAPLSGTKSLWCGIRPGVSADPTYAYAPGYGDHWTQILQFQAMTTLGAFRTVHFSALMRYDLVGADRLVVEYRNPAGTDPWIPLGTYAGSGAVDNYTWQVTTGTGIHVEFRFVVYTDGSGSDETDVDTYGAVVLDDVRLTDVQTGTGLYYYSFEGDPVGAISMFGGWAGSGQAGYGLLAGLVAGTSVAQAGTPNTTPVWSFFNGSTASYACGGYSGQAAVPYTTVPGSTCPGDYLANEVRSPLIDISIDQNNQPADPAMGALAAEFDVYADLSPGSNGVVYGYRWRFVVNGVLQPWQLSALYFATTPFWTRTTTLPGGGASIPPGATHAQFSLIALDYGYSGWTFGTCHSQSPLFDNVKIIRMYSPVVVTGDGNAGIGSMRQAIVNANANPDFNAMVFILEGAGPHTISLVGPLPAITGPLWIDGFTQPGSIANTSQFASTSAQLMVAINGEEAGPYADGLWYLPGGYGVVRGVAIGAFTGAGIRYESTSLIATGCSIGTDGTGTVSSPNGRGIVAVTGGMDIGGPLLQERMLISANWSNAIDVMAGECHILNTHIGYDANGNELANGEGIHVFGGPYCQIGSPQINPCGGEHTDRVWIKDGNILVEPAAQNVSIYQVRLDGGTIDLNNDGPTANDPGDADSGANSLQNFPVLASAGSNTVTGNMDGLANTTHHIEFFSGDGASGVTKYLGYQDVTTDGTGHADINFSCAPILPGTIITATATAGLNTSEFGPWVTSMNTPPGFPSPLVNLYDAQQQLRATVQFDAAYAAGNTFLSATTPSDLPNAGTWDVGGTPQYWDISTNVPYSGAVHVCLYYDPASVPEPEGTLRLLHYENFQWVDVTDVVDIAANRICGTVTSLSPFVVAKHTGATGVGDGTLPDAFALHANIPNPFNPVTTIHYDVPLGGAHVTISVFDVRGALVRTLVSEQRAPGSYTTQWNGDDNRGGRAASGVYFYRMTAGSFVENRKMVLLK